jgi:DNA-binding MarR family transcriptional regulator
MNRDLVEQIAGQLQSFALRLAREVRRGEAAGTPGASRLSALAALASLGSLSLAQLAAADQVRAPTMSRLVDGLVRDGLVTRETVPTNRRAVRIAITPEGAALLSRERKRRVQRLADRLERLGESEQRAVQRGVELLGRVSGRP